MRYTEFLTEDELFEINMSPSNLTKLVKDIPGAKVGLEFEMIVPDAKVTDDGDYENDYDYDERARSFEGIEDFFSGGDGNNSRRDVREMIQALREKYYEWVSEQRWEDWQNNGYDFFKEYAEDLFDTDDAEEEAREEISTEFPDLQEEEPEEFLSKVDDLVEQKKEAWLQEQWENQSGFYDDARENWEEGQDYPDEDDWLDNEGYRYMSDLERFGHDHDVYWPHQTNNSSSETNIDAIGEEFSDAVGREVKASAGYHNINRGSQAEEGFYILETDGSLSPNDDDDEAGLEFVSPPLPVSEMMDEIKKVAAWAEERGAYTGKKNRTGLHMNVSVPNYSKDKLDFVKLALLLGDNHILKEFDRYVVQGTNYAQSSFDLLAKSLKSNPDKAKKMMEAMKNHFDLAASKAIHSGSTDKYTSINVKDNRVEFRGPGNNYLGLFKQDPNKLLAPMMRMVVALEAAVDPEKYRNEYQKKLYKLLSSSVKSKDLLELFTDYAAGKGIPQSAFKSFLKQRKSERDLERELTKPGEGIRVAGRKSNPDGDWVLFRQHRREADYNRPFDVEVLYRFNAANQRDADIVRDQYVSEHNPSFQVLMGSDPEKKNGQPGDYKPQQKPQDDGKEGAWGVYRKSDGRHMRLNGEYMVYKDKTLQDAQTEFDILTTQHSLDSSNYELRRLSKYELYNRETGRTVEYDNKPIEYYASSPDEAENKKGRYVADFGLGATENFGVRSALTVPAQTTTSSGEMELYNVRRLSTDTIVSAFRVPNHAAAVQKFQDFLMRTGGDNTNFRLERADRNGESTGETPAQTVPTATGAPQATAANGVPMWVIYRISDGEVVHRFADHVSSHTRTALSWLRDQNYENPAMLFRVRAMTQDEQQQAQPLPGSTADLQQQRAQGGFTGSWKVIDSATGQELYRFGGVGNNQADANRVAAEWAQRNMVSDPFEVYPIMGGQ